MNQRIILLTATLLGAFAVGIGAFGAHAFKAMLLSNGRLETYELAVRYQFYHTLALLAIGILAEKYPALKAGAALITIGTIIFCGSLYIVAMANQSAWGAVTPIGGVLMIAGWLSAGWTIFKSHQ